MQGVREPGEPEGHCTVCSRGILGGSWENEEEEVANDDRGQVHDDLLFAEIRDR